MKREILLPLAEQAALELRAGEEVELTGAVLTGRDQACARLFQMILEQAELPVDLIGQLIYFVGPSPASLTAPYCSCTENCTSVQTRLHTPKEWISAATIAGSAGP